MTTIAETSGGRRAPHNLRPPDVKRLEVAERRIDLDAVDGGEFGVTVHAALTRTNRRNRVKGAIAPSVTRCRLVGPARKRDSQPATTI